MAAAAVGTSHPESKSPADTPRVAGQSLVSKLKAVVAAEALVEQSTSESEDSGLSATCKFSKHQQSFNKCRSRAGI